MTLSLIAAIGKNNELGKNNSLLWNLPKDMAHFRETTRGHAVIMGRKTFESIGQPLPNRRNVVITRDASYAHEGIEVAHSLNEALELFSKSDEEVFVIGGAEIYIQALNKADKLYITCVNESFHDADTFFPVIDEHIWKKVKAVHHPKDELHSYDLEIREYIK